MMSMRVGIEECGCLRLYCQVHSSRAQKMGQSGSLIASTEEGTKEYKGNCREGER